MSKRCVDKKRYRTVLDAKIALTVTKIKENGETRFYKCPICKGYHLTSQPRRRK